MTAGKAHVRKTQKRQGAKRETGSPAAPSFADKKTYLMQPQIWPDKTVRAGLYETHLSCVFLTDKHAWKMKKPVKRAPFFDFRTVEKRRYYCEEELRLNRRLAPDIYLAVVPLVLRHGKSLFLDESGLSGRDRDDEVVDWLVKMVRLPEEKTLRDHLVNDDIGDNDIDVLAHRLIRFFEEAETVGLSPEDYIERFHNDIDYNYKIILQSGYDVPRAALHDIYEQQAGFLKQGRSLLARRVREGRIIEGHGDLRPEHIYLLSPDPPVIIDCLEFSRDLRILDKADELSFLQMACAVMGHEDVGEKISRIYSHVTGDRLHPAVMAFYASVRALTRARLALVHMQEVPDSDPQRWHGKCVRYLQWARYYGEQQGQYL